jgi:hypothetical protein
MKTFMHIGNYSMPFAPLKRSMFLAEDKERFERLQQVHSLCASAFDLFQTRHLALIIKMRAKANRFHRINDGYLVMRR